jgi:hypothetical protein
MSNDDKSTSSSEQEHLRLTMSFADEHGYFYLAEGVSETHGCDDCQCRNATICVGGRFLCGDCRSNYVVVRVEKRSVSNDAAAPVETTDKAATDWF